jgi:hypothetical protein
MFYVNQPAEELWVLHVTNHNTQSVPTAEIDGL